MSLNNRVKLVRLSTGLGQSAFAKTINVSKSAYDRYEGEGYAVPNEVISMVIKVYNIHTDWLMFGEGGESIRYKNEFVEKDKYEIIERKLHEVQEKLIRYQEKKIEDLEEEKEILKVER